MHLPWRHTQKGGATLCVQLCTYIGPKTAAGPYAWSLTEITPAELPLRQQVSVARRLLFEQLPTISALTESHFGVCQFVRVSITLQLLSLLWVPLRAEGGTSECRRQAGGISSITCLTQPKIPIIFYLPIVFSHCLVIDCLSKRYRTCSSLILHWGKPALIKEVAQSATWSSNWTRSHAWDFWRILSPQLPSKVMEVGRLIPPGSSEHGSQGADRSDDFPFAHPGRGCKQEQKCWNTRARRAFLRHASAFAARRNQHSWQSWYLLLDPLGSCKQIQFFICKL